MTQTFQPFTLLFALALGPIALAELIGTGLLLYRWGCHGDQGANHHVRLEEIVSQTNSLALRDR